MENQFSPRHEKLNFLSHAIGFVVFFVTIPVLFKNKFDFSIALFLFSGLFMLFSSSLYHYLTDAKLKAKVRIFDHISIFWVIGATTFPFVKKYTSEETYLVFTSIQWSLIALGMLLKVFFTGKYRLFSSLVYIAIGGMVLLLGSKFWNAIPDLSFRLVAAGGLMYLVGVIFYQNRKIPYNHFIWHVFVLVALALQAAAIYYLET